MKIFALVSGNENFEELLNIVGKFVSIDTFDDDETMYLGLNEDCAAVLLDLDDELKKKDKLIRKIRKESSDLPIFALCNNLDSKKLAKHQKGKSSADLYFRSPLDKEVVELMLGEFFEFASDTIDDSVQEDIIKDHQGRTSIGKDAMRVSAELDNLFAGVFLTDYAERGFENNTPANASFDEGFVEEVDDIDDIEEIDLGDATLGGDDLGDDLAMEELEAVDELSLGEEVEGEELADFNDDSGELALGQEQEVKEDDDQCLSLDDELETVLPDESDLAFPEMDELSLSDDSSEAIEESEPADEGISLDSDGLEELSLGDDDSAAVEVSAEDDGALELGDDLALPEFSDEEVSTQGADDVDEFSLDLGSGDEPVQEASVEEQEEALSISEENDEDNDEFSLDDSLDGDSLQVEEDLAFNITDDSDEVDELSLGGEEEAEAELSLGEDEDDDGVNDSQLFDLGGVEEKPEEEAGAELNLASDNISDGGGLQLPTDAPDDLESSLSLGEENEDLADTVNLDEELTRPALDTDMVGLSLGADEEEESESESEDIGFSDDLLFGGGEEAPEEPVEEKENTLTHMFVQEDEVGKLEQENAERKKAKGSLPVAPDLSEDVLGEEVDDALAFSEEPVDEPIVEEIAEKEFSTEVSDKLKEIDALMGDGADESILDHMEENTLVAANADSPTRVTEVDKTEIFNETADQSPTAQFERSRSRNVSIDEELKQEHKEFIASHDEELIRLGETIKNLREDREDLRDRISSLEEKQDSEQKETLDLQAQLDEKKIEITVLKKRYEKQIEDLKYQLDLSADKKDSLVIKNKQIEEELLRSSREKKLDVNRIKARERELEEKLEMLKKDAEVQLRNRDQKILQLKRKIDTLEFDIETAQINEKKSHSSQQELEDRLGRVIRTLRSTLGHLEEEGSTEDRLRDIKKNLDV